MDEMENGTARAGVTAVKIDGVKYVHEIPLCIERFDAKEGRIINTQAAMKAALYGPDGVIAIHPKCDDINAVYQKPDDRCLSRGEIVDVSAYTSEGYQRIARGIKPTDAIMFVTELLPLLDGVTRETAEGMFKEKEKEIKRIRNKYVPRVFAFDVNIKLTSQFKTYIRALSAWDAKKSLAGTDWYESWLSFFSDDIDEVIENADLEDIEIEIADTEPVDEEL
jgi:hypothetical protein